MNKDLIEFYEEEKNKIQREISDLWEVGKKSSKRTNRLVEIDYILDGLYANKEIEKLKKENKELKLQLKGTTHCFDEEEHEKLKKQVEEYKDKINWYENFEVNKTIDKLRLKHNNQQKEFIDYMNKTIEELESDDVDDEEMKGYLIQRIDTFKEILQKYKSIIGYKDEQN